jgi:hypothetical protein
MARETISRLENGRPARRHVILGLADALALAPSELTGRTELDALTGEAYKKCKGCGALRPLPRFVQVKGARYFYPRCRTCRAECARERYHADAEQRAAQISRAQRNRLKHKLAVA